MKFGETVIVSATYWRRTTYRMSKNGPWNITVKVWERKEITPRLAIYLGKRTLWNGTRTWEDEVGNVFEPEEHIKALLVCFSAHTNPVYVPVDSVALHDIKNNADQP